MADETPTPALPEPSPATEPSPAPPAPPAPAAETPAAPATPTPLAAAAESPAIPAPAAAVETPKAPAKKAAKAKKAGSPTTEATKPDSLSLTGEIEKVKVVKAKGSKNVHTGIAHVFSTFNNTTVTITDQNGNVIAWSSAGKMNFRGSRKSTAYAAQVVAQDACRQAMGHGLKEVEVRVKGPGAGRESAVRAMQAVGLEVSIIRDVTPVPHNGCRPPKQRRV